MSCNDVEEALDALHVLLDRSVASLFLRYPDSRKRIQGRVCTICDETKDWWAHGVPAPGCEHNAGPEHRITELGKLDHSLSVPLEKMLGAAPVLGENLAAYLISASSARPGQDNDGGNIYHAVVNIHNDEPDISQTTGAESGRSNRNMQSASTGDAESNHHSIQNLSNAPQFSERDRPVADALPLAEAASCSNTLMSSKHSIIRGCQLHTTIKHREAKGLDPASNHQEPYRPHVNPGTSHKSPSDAARRDGQNKSTSNSSYRGAPRSNPSTLPFRELSKFAPGTITPTTILEQIQAHVVAVSSQDLATALCFFFAIGSPESFHRLQGVCAVAREGESCSRLPHTSTAADYVRALDRLDVAEAKSSILRRYFLARLASRYNARQEKSLGNDPKLRPRELKFGYAKSRRHATNEGHRRAATRALEELLIEAYPDLAMLPKSSTLYQRKAASLKQKLSCAQKWDALARRFSLGILSVIPTGVEFGIFNSKIETLHQRVFHLLVDLLDEHRGMFLRNIGDSLSEIYELLVRKDMSFAFSFEGLTDLCDLPYDGVPLMEACVSQQRV